MCGFVAVVAKGTSPRPDSDLLERMSRTLVHRGPDDHGVQVIGPVGLGHRRLSIIDLEGGHQPMASPDGAVWIAFNGEIYNFPELVDRLRAAGRTLAGRSDTETLIAAYQEWGEGMLEHLNGMFAFVLYDTNADRVFAARDRFGEKPLFLLDTPDRIFFASEQKALHACGALTPRFDPVALYQYFTYGYIQGPHTIFQGLQKLPPGSAWSRTGDAEPRQWRYWEAPPARFDLTDPERAVDAVQEVLRDAVKIRLVSDVPIGFFLSGGTDSSLVVAVAAEVADERLETFSVGFEEPRYDERAYARQVADRFQTQHHEFLLKPDDVEAVENLAWHLDEPFADSSALPTYYLSKMTRSRVKVALSGDGGDEMFAGYDVYKGHVLSERIRRLGPLLPLGSWAAGALARMDSGRRETWERLSRNLLDARLPAETRFLAKQHMIFRGDALRDLTGSAWVEEGARREREVSGSFFNAYPPLEAITAWQRSVSLVDDMLVKVDRMSMANSLEVRAPLLDHRFAELLQRIPFSVRMPGLKTKFLLKRALERYMPRDFVWRDKKGFVVPLDRWFRGDLGAYAEDKLLGSEAMVGGLFHPQGIRDLVTEHRSGRHSRGPAIWALLMFESWCRAYGVGPEALGDLEPVSGGAAGDS